MKPLQAHEVSYIIEAKIRGVSVQEVLKGSLTQEVKPTETVEVKKTRKPRKTKETI